MSINVFPTKDYENQLFQKLQKNKPNQSQPVVSLSNLFQTGHLLVNRVNPKLLNLHLQNTLAVPMVKAKKAGKVRQKIVRMHRVIIGAAEGEIVDRINRNGVDNWKTNLRPVTCAQNSWNSGKLSANIGIQNCEKNLRELASDCSRKLASVFQFEAEYIRNDISSADNTYQLSLGFNRYLAELVFRKSVDNIQQVVILIMTYHISGHAILDFPLCALSIHQTPHDVLCGYYSHKLIIFVHHGQACYIPVSHHSYRIKYIRSCFDCHNIPCHYFFEAYHGHTPVV